MKEEGVGFVYTTNPGREQDLAELDRIIDKVVELPMFEDTETHIARPTD
jgi:hypothetical protein